ncbi:MAG: DUF2452 domain-containing protein [Halieaceae bacterium]|jgi:hypothetical protein|nr:DUF2452 domain-containing protein [Halieaceae bacterium]
MKEENADKSSMLHPGGNPQGKGLTLVLDQLAGLAPRGVQAKNIEQVLADYWQSTLVLSADFNFRVIPGKVYYLYRSDRWQLSLISPNEWGSRVPGVFVAECELANDATWQVSFADQALASAPVVEALGVFLEGFEHRVTSAETLSQALPEYEAGLPYQQRMMATALTASLRHSARLSGCAMIAPKLAVADWRAIAAPTQSG